MRSNMAGWQLGVYGYAFWLPWTSLTIGYNKRLLDQTVNHLYAYERTIDTIENLCVIVVGSIPRERSTSPTPCWWHAAGLLTYRSFIPPSQLCQLTVDSWQLTVSQWLIRIWTSDCESQQRDCAGIAPASLNWMRCKGTTNFWYMQEKSKKNRFFGEGAEKLFCIFVV